MITGRNSRAEWKHGWSVSLETSILSHCDISLVCDFELIPYPLRPYLAIYKMKELKMVIPLVSSIPKFLEIIVFQEVICGRIFCNNTRKDVKQFLIFCGIRVGEG